MYYPLKSSEYMKINGDPPELGFWQKGLGPVNMTPAVNEIVWLTGEKVKPWEFNVKFKQGECPSRICYKFLIRDDGADTTVWEREPSRFLDIQDPSGYRGELGNSGSNSTRNASKCFVVNGHVEKADANFVGGLTFDKIGDLGIHIGPYP
jgi:hypothetical protein